MKEEEKINSFTDSINSSLVDDSFVSITLANYRGEAVGLKNIYIKKILIKQQPHLSFTYRNSTNDIVKNYVFEKGVQQIKHELQMGFKFATLFTTNFDLTIEEKKEKNSVLKKSVPTKLKPVSLDHNKIKNHLIAASDKPYLTDLKITDAKGNVFNATQDKFKQINHYIQILSSILKELPTNKILNIVDMGAGKGYLTFALYDYLNNILNLPANVIGVEYRKDLVNLCTKIAQKNNFEKLRFIQGTIDNYNNNEIDILIALHACDTATDDAIAKGINANAQLIVVAPCCHKQIRNEIESEKKENDIQFITKHGIFLERQAEMVTDAIRALVLEYFGYKTKVFEFITDAHTPKNIMITAIKNKIINNNKNAILKKIEAAKLFFGIRQHYLEKLLDL
jgi:SAM-dependent methyltransferase